MSAKQQITEKRRVCAACLRAQSRCICHWVAVVPHAVEVLILQHPLEVTQVKGSARLLHLSLPGSRLLVGETFGEAELAPLLAAKNSVLLYPATPADPALAIAAPAPLLADWLEKPASLQLVVLDGTWRKSRKMLYLNPLLQMLPRLPLETVPASHYLIRKAHAAHQLSTLEATCYALAQLERDGARFQPLLDAFDGFVARQLGDIKRLPQFLTDSA